MLEAILIGLMVLGAIKAVQMAIVTFQAIYQWFNEQENVDIDSIGFTLQEALESGSYAVVQGVFNKATEQVTAVRRIVGDKLDDKLTRFHDGNELVVYE